VVTLLSISEVSAFRLHTSSAEWTVAKRVGWGRKMEQSAPRATSRLCMADGKQRREIPQYINFDASQIELKRVLGKVEIMVPGAEGQPTSTSVRLFESRLEGGTRCFLKEYLPVASAFGKRELTASRTLTNRWNEREKNDSSSSSSSSSSSGSKESTMSAVDDNDDEEGSDDWVQSAYNEIAAGPQTTPENVAAGEKPRNLASLQEDLREFEGKMGKSADDVPPFPILLGYLRPDERMEGEAFVAEVFSGMRCVVLNYPALDLNIACLIPCKRACNRYCLSARPARLSFAACHRPYKDDSWFWKGYQLHSTPQLCPTLLSLLLSILR
jgi:hypothetical protein